MSHLFNFCAFWLPLPTDRPTAAPPTRFESQRRMEWTDGWNEGRRSLKGAFLVLNHRVLGGGGVKREAMEGRKGGLRLTLVVMLLAL